MSDDTESIGVPTGFSTFPRLLQAALYSRSTGAIVVPRALVQNVKLPLRALNWSKSGINVTGLRSSADLLAIHVTSEAVTEISAWLAEPSDPTPVADCVGSDTDMDTIAAAKHSLRTHLRSGAASWHPHLRVRSPDCIHASGKRDDAAYKHAPKVALPDPHAAPFTYIELFAGIGGFRVALDALGGRSVFASEINDAARFTYVSNFGNEVWEGGKAVLVGDITEIETEHVPEHTILTAGFPCQSFCKVGDRTGLEDHRGELFFEVVRVLKGKQPRAFILENVANLVTMEEGRVFEIIQHHLKEAGYHIHHKVIDASSYIPQTRKRVYIIGFRHHAASTSFAWPPSPTTKPPRLRDILQNNEPHWHLTSHQMDKLRESYTWKRNPSWRISRVNLRARTLMSSYRSGFIMYSEFVPVPLPEYSATDEEEETEEGVPVDESSELDALPVAKRPKLDIPDTLRFYSPRECARIMGFPESFVLTHVKTPGTLYHQLGNAVCPPVVGALGKQVLEALKAAE
ncbi:S-adenosyl-L-methionine-dependent methyltransferase [Chytriomyces sp. MP71]|nr:S-adenosyl-L-methionine-dependent methyltransferase [Chytriomyces sp. MP71]